MGSSSLVFTITATRQINCGQLTSNDFNLGNGMGFTSWPRGTASTCTVTVSSGNFGSLGNRTVNLSGHFAVTDSTGNTVDENRSTGGFPMTWSVDRRAIATALALTPPNFTGGSGTTGSSRCRSPRASFSTAGQ